jgi:hypothetical protein
MAIATNTVTRYDATKSVREDLANVIYNISPTDTVFMNNVGRGKVEQTYSEWQTESLASPDTNNAQLEGDDAPAADAFVATNRVGNYTQISRKIAQVSGTVESVGLAGMKSMMGHEMAKKSAELKIDMEAILTGNQAAVVGNNSTARKTAALGAWLRTNDTFGTGGASPTMSATNDGYPQTAAVAGTARAFAESDLKSLIQSSWTNGGKINRSFVMVGPFNKIGISAFDGIATRFRDVPAGKQAQIIGAADVYVSDFGQVNIVPNRFQPEGNIYLVDPELVDIAYLRGFRTEALAKTGDNTKRMLIVEYLLKVKQEKGLAVFRDATTA